MRKMTKLMLALALPVALLAGGNAFAATKITTWNYENQFAFTANTSSPGPGPVTTVTTNTHPTFALGSGPANPASGGATTLAWGVPASASGKSRFRLSDSTGVPTDGKITGVETVDDGVFVPDLSLFHDNFVITGASLTSVTLTGALLLTANTPPTGDEFGPLVGTFKILFKETPNAGVAGVCADGAPRPCPDIFVIDSAGSSPLTNLFLGTIDGFDYFLDLDISGLALVGPESCASVNPAQAFPCFGFVTKENQVSSLDIKFQVRTVNRNVPEPGVLALLGLGLAGIGFGQIRRRK
jgi:PEP-CTERM motif